MPCTLSAFPHCSIIPQAEACPAVPGRGKARGKWGNWPNSPTFTGDAVACPRDVSATLVRLAPWMSGCHSETVPSSITRRRGNMRAFNNNPVPSEGTPIRFQDDKLIVPDDPIIPFIEGDGTGRDIWRASRLEAKSLLVRNLRRRESLQRVPVVAAGRHAGSHQRISNRHQRAADHAGGRRHPQP